MRVISAQESFATGVGFRSALEAVVAEELRTLGVEFEYEQPAEIPGGVCRFYLPDFTIRSAPESLRLPGWVEVKPQEMLYTLRDDLRISRKHGERFKGEIGVEDCDAARLRSMGHAELCKPKRLAELSGQAVLVVGGVGGTERLSVEMQPDMLVFSRSHPVVNQEGLRKQREREKRNAQYEREAQAARERWAAMERERQRVAQESHGRMMARLLTTTSKSRNKFESRCFGCSAVVPAQAGRLYSGVVIGMSWLVLCGPCASGAN